MGTPTPTHHSVRCYHCDHPFDVGARAASTNCPGCNQRVVVEDVVIKKLMPVSRVQTCGRLVIEKKGTVIAEVVQAQGGVEVMGSLDARVESGGPVVIGASARWKGDCRAPTMAIRRGARIEGEFEVLDPGP
ncbi:MAG: polymer-forming cytoskeletal protein [Planctomycetota bacterium]|nr:polymer-forming cytoskeletal protein [Planctomycetota bacterium]